MRILWFSHIPIGESTQYAGGNWISSLLSAMSIIPEVEIAVCYESYNSNDTKKQHDNITFYRITKKRNSLQKIIQKHRHKLSELNKDKCLSVIEDFKPDIIQIFGTESAFGLLSKYTKIPIIIHIQGILNSCVEHWFPEQMNQRLVFQKTSIKALLLGNGYFHRYYQIKKQAKRELRIIRENKYFFTRTKWDTETIKSINTNAITFHCDEILREKFYCSERNFESQQPETVKMVSVMNGEIYKGLDNVIKITNLLTKKHTIKFKWTIIGIEEKDPSIKLFEASYKTCFSDNSVVFAGIKKEEELVHILLKSDIFLHVSHIDNSPNSVCEAMITALPVICNDVGGCSSIICDKQNGLLLPDNSPDLWTETICELISTPEEMSRLGKNARNSALLRHSKQHIIKSVYDTYQDIIHMETFSGKDSVL